MSDVKISDLISKFIELLWARGDTQWGMVILSHPVRWGICDKSFSPIKNYDITVETIRAVMEHVGLWDEFVEWHWHMCREWISILDVLSKGNFRMSITFDIDAYTDILTDPALLIQACISFMEGRE